MTVEVLERVGYLVDLQAAGKLAEGTVTQWLHAFPFGIYKHPYYGQIIMTPERARKMAEGVNTKIRGIDLAIDYEHRSSEKAAGWVKAADVRDDGLWLLVEWTPNAVSAVQNGEYRYFSPEYASKWTHPKTGVTYTDVLMGGGLTNRPFLKDILPVNLSEILGGEWQTDENGNVIFNDHVVFPSKEDSSVELLRRLAEALGVELAEDLSEDDVITAIQKAFQAKNDPPTTDPKPEPTPALSEAEITQLIEEHPQMAQFAEAFKAQQALVESQNRKIDALEASARLSEVNHRLAEWHNPSAGAKFGLPVALDEKLRTFMLGAPSETLVRFNEIIGEILKTGLVKLGETTPRSPRSDREPSDVMARVEEKQKAFQKEAVEKGETLSDADALDMVFAEDEDLYEEYRLASYSFEQEGVS